MSSSVDNEYFSDGITEEIINALAKLGGLKVTSRTSSFYFKGKNIPVREIAQQLNVSTILEGSVRLSGKSMRITAQLIQAKEDFHFWSETWDRKYDDVFEVQDEISLLIAEKLREHFGHFEIQEHLVSKQTSSLDAYTLFLKGRYSFNKWNPDDVKKAMGFYQQALEIDPNHTNSMVGLADAYSFLATCGFIPFEEGWGKCSELTNKALGINSQLPSAYYQLANLEFFTACDFSKSFWLTQKGLAIDPNHVELQQFMAFLCILAGEKEKAYEHLNVALSVDPLSQETQFYSAYLDYMIEDFSASLTKLDACLKVNPMNIPVHSVKALWLLMTGHYDEAIGYYDSLPSEIVVAAERVGTIALAAAFKNDKKLLAEYSTRLQEQAATPDGFTADSYLFLLFAVTGQNEEAFAWVDRAIAKRSPLVLLRFSDPVVFALKEDKRYHGFHKQLFPEELFFDNENEIQKKKVLPDSKATQEQKEKLLKYVETEQPYLDPELSLRSLAGELDISPNQLSLLLNEGIGKNFNEFINHHRILEFKRLAKEPSNANLTVMGLAYDSGFNSKTVFNTYFKKETGLTPKQYINSL